MKPQKHQPRPVTEVPAKPLREVPKTDLERAENEGMTVSPNPDATNIEGVKIGKAHTDKPETGGVEGEGSYTAARRYREGVERDVEKGDTEELATQAAEALDGPEGDELRAAEERAKRGQTPQAPKRGREQYPVSQR